MLPPSPALGTRLLAGKVGRICQEAGAWAVRWLWLESNCFFIEKYGCKIVWGSLGNPLALPGCRLPERLSEVAGRQHLALSEGCLSVWPVCQLSAPSLTLPGHAPVLGCRNRTWEGAIRQLG